MVELVGGVSVINLAIPSSFMDNGTILFDCLACLALVWISSPSLIGTGRWFCPRFAQAAQIYILVYMKQEAIESSTVAILDLILAVQLDRLVFLEKENSRTGDILLRPVLLVASLQPWPWFARGGGGFPPPPSTFLPIHPDVGLCYAVTFKMIAFLAEHIPGEEIGSWERVSN